MSLSPLSLACFVGLASAAVLELPIWFRNTYAVIESKVGTPSEQHFLLFDTGSATTWMVDSGCVNDPATCPNSSGYARNGYKANASSTAALLGTSASIGYLGGGTAGVGVSDVFSVPSASNLSWEQTFLSANQSSWRNLPCDGFMGLAFSTITVGNTTTVVETLMRDKLLDAPRFALYYGTELNDTGSSAGSGALTLGGSHEDVYVDGNVSWVDLQYADPSTSEVWRADMQYVVGTQAPAGNLTSSGQTTIPLSGSWVVFDTGAARMSVPPEYIESIYASIGMNWTEISSGAHLPLCTEFTDDWSVSFAIGKSISPATITITGSQLAAPGFGPADAGDKYCWPPFDESQGNGFFLFGQQFLRQFYSIWDFGGFVPDEYHPKVGFGALSRQYKP